MQEVEDLPDSLPADRALVRSESPFIDRVTAELFQHGQGNRPLPVPLARMLEAAPVDDDLLQGGREPAPELGEGGDRRDRTELGAPAEHEQGLIERVVRFEPDRVDSESLDP